MQIKQTSKVERIGINMLVYGDAGVGKTVLASTLETPIILSVEAGLLSLSGKDIPYIDVTSVDQVREAYAWLTQDKQGMAYRSIAIDSLSELAELTLREEKEKNKDPRVCYPAMQDSMTALIRAFRSLRDRNVYFTAKLGRVQVTEGSAFFGPSAPGRALGESFPYIFDEVFLMRVGEGGARQLVTQGDSNYIAKDRSGKLDRVEPADLSAVIQKIKSNVVHK